MYLSASPSSLITSNDATATALAKGFPPKVLGIEPNQWGVSSKILQPHSGIRNSRNLNIGMKPYTQLNITFKLFL